MKSGDHGLASAARQSSIPCSGSFTEACTVYSKGQTRLGEALLPVYGGRCLGGRGHAVRGATPVIWCSGEVERAWGSTIEVPGGFIGAGAATVLTRLGATRGTRGRACSSELSARRTRVGLFLLLFYPLLSGQNVRILP